MYMKHEVVSIVAFLKWIKFPQERKNGNSSISHKKLLDSRLDGAADVAGDWFNSSTLKR